MCLKWITLVTFYMSAVLLLHTRVSYPRSDAHRGCRVTPAFNPAVMCHFRRRADCKNTELIWTRTASHEMKTLFSITAFSGDLQHYREKRRGHVTSFNKHYSSQSISHHQLYYQCHQQTLDTSASVWTGGRDMHHFPLFCQPSADMPACGLLVLMLSTQIVRPMAHLWLAWG